jgi:bifunctional DNA-binding transcriptional regulator/antitoxin component of YhaV-PrlF toxin-antitoxin module
MPVRVSEKGRIVIPAELRKTRYPALRKSS